MRAKRKSKSTKASTARKRRLNRATLQKMLVDLCERLDEDVRVVRGLRMHLQAQSQRHAEAAASDHRRGSITPDDYGVVVAEAAVCRLESHLHGMSFGFAEIVRDAA